MTDRSRKPSKSPDAAPRRTLLEWLTGRRLNPRPPIETPLGVFTYDPRHEEWSSSIDHDQIDELNVCGETVTSSHVANFERMLAQLPTLQPTYSAFLEAHWEGGLEYPLQGAQPHSLSIDEEGMMEVGFGFDEPEEYGAILEVDRDGNPLQAHWYD